MKDYSGRNAVVVESMYSRKNGKHKIDPDLYYDIVNVDKEQLVSRVKGNTLIKYISEKEINFVNVSRTEPYTVICSSKTAAVKKESNKVALDLEHGKVVSNSLSVDVKLNVDDNYTRILIGNDLNICLKTQISGDSKHMVIESLSPGNVVSIYINGSIVKECPMGYNGKLTRAIVDTRKMAIEYDNEDGDSNEKKVIILDIW